VWRSLQKERQGPPADLPDDLASNQPESESKRHKTRSAYFTSCGHAAKYPGTAGDLVAGASSELQHTGDKIGVGTCSVKLTVCPRTYPAPESGCCAPAFNNRTAA
jgi:hypothetical protein